MQGTTGAFCLRQVEGVCFSVIGKRGLGLFTVRDGQIELASALMLRADGMALAVHLHRTLDVDVLAILVRHLESHGTTGIGNQVTALGVEVHFQSFLFFLLDTGLRAADDVFLAVVA